MYVLRIKNFPFPFIQIVDPQQAHLGVTIVRRAYADSTAEPASCEPWPPPSSPPPQYGYWSLSAGPGPVSAAEEAAPVRRMSWRKDSALQMSVAILTTCGLKGRRRIEGGLKED